VIHADEMEVNFKESVAILENGKVFNIFHILLLLFLLVFSSGLLIIQSNVDKTITMSLLTSVLVYIHYNIQIIDVTENPIGR